VEDIGLDERKNEDEINIELINLFSVCDLRLIRND